METYSDKAKISDEAEISKTGVTLYDHKVIKTEFQIKHVLTAKVSHFNAHEYNHM